MLQVYDCDIVHIPRKSNPADFPSKAQCEGAQEHGGCTCPGGVDGPTAAFGRWSGAKREDSKKIERSFQGQVEKMNSLHSLNSLLVSRSNISLEPQLRETILKGLS